MCGWIRNAMKLDDPPSREASLPSKLIRQVPRSFLWRRTHYRRKSLAALGIALGVLVAGLVITANPSGAFSRHTVCVNQSRLGNVTAWSPRQVVDGPYLGRVSFSFSLRYESSWGVSLLTEAPTDGESNTSALWLGATNWSIYRVSNVSALGNGPNAPCFASLIAEQSLPPPVGGGYVSTTLSGPEMVSTSTQLNSSDLCATSSLPASCGISATFDVAFTPPGVGSVDTCGLSKAESLGVETGPIGLQIPFTWNGRNYSVMADYNVNAIGITDSFESWENYTFPANVGVWKYSYILGSPTGNGYRPPAGLAFSYESCP